MQDNSMQARGATKIWLARRGMGLVFALLLLVTACGGGSSSSTHANNSTQPTPGSQAANAVILDILNNIKTNGYNASTNGLYINWRYGTNPLLININGAGTSDGPSRHDPLTDMRYLHNLLLYKSQHASDSQFDSEIQRYAAIVKGEFGNTSNDRGWVYDEFIDIYNLSHDSAYQDIARNLATNFASQITQSNIGIAIKTNAGHANGYYRVDEQLEAGCALIQAGTVFNNPDWVTMGKNAVQFLYAHAYLASAHVFLIQMDNVVQADGSANPNETIYRDTYQNTKIDGGSVRFGAIGQEVLSLLHVYMVTKDQDFLNKATDLLTDLTADNNSLGLWDAQNLGYFYAINVPGNDFQHPGTPSLTKGTKKESGRQIQMLEAFHLANMFTNNRYQTMQDLMQRVLLEKAYYAPGHGIVYEMTNDWKTIALKNSAGQEDWVTTEAMGIGLESLLSLTAANPW